MKKYTTNFGLSYSSYSNKHNATVIILSFMHIRLRLRLQPWPALQVREFDWWMQFYGNLLHSIWGFVITVGM